jgi:ribosomal protein S18 acetylase RimI-like enzyme
MEIRTLLNIEHTRLLDAFNLSFSDYLLPFHLTMDQLEFKWRAEQIRPELSVGAFEGERLIAFILHGAQEINGQLVVYNGGTGVIPEKRGLGLVGQMYTFIQPILKKRDVQQVVLEVLSENKPAIRAYEKLNFLKLRKLSCYSGLIVPKAADTDVDVRPLDKADLHLLQSFWDITPTWQNSAYAVAAIGEDAISLGAYKDSTLMGYIVFHPHLNKIYQVAVAPDFRRQGVGTELIMVANTYCTGKLNITNIDAQALDFGLFLNTLGLKMYIQQYEMEKQLID